MGWKASRGGARHKNRRETMPDNVSARLEQIEKTLNILSKKIDALSEHTDLMVADQALGINRKLEDILEFLRLRGSGPGQI
jgi:hypothetical protein